jgi:hypothetical protein
MLVYYLCVETRDSHSTPKPEICPSAHCTPRDAWHTSLHPINNTEVPELTNALYLLPILQQIFRHKYSRTKRSTRKFQLFRLPIVERRLPYRGSVGSRTSSVTVLGSGRCLTICWVWCC